MAQAKKDPWAEFADAAPPPAPSVALATPTLRQIVAPQPKQPPPQTAGQAEGVTLTNERTRRDLSTPQAVPGAPGYFFGADGKPFKMEGLPTEGADPTLKAAIKGLGLEELLLSVGRAKNNLKSFWATGIPGAVAGRIPGTSRANLLGNLDSLQGGIILEKLQVLKEASKTGASGLGPMSDREGSRLAAAVSALDPNMSDDELAISLAVIERHAKTLQALSDGVDPRDPAVEKQYGIPPLPGAEGARPDAEDIHFTTPPEAPGQLPQLTAEKRAQLDAFLKTKQPGSLTAPEIDAVFFGLTGQHLNNAEEWVTHYNKTGAFSPEIAAPPPPDISDMRSGDEVVDPIARGVADTVTLGFADELAAGVNTVTGEGSYSENLARERAINDYDEENNFWLRAGGQLAGGAALPLFAARTPAQLAKVGAAYGGGYGAGSSESLGDVPGNVAAGVGIGAAAGWGGGKLMEKLAGRAASRAPAAAGETPADRYARGQRFGLDLAVGDVRGMGSKATERLLDVQPGSAGLMNAGRQRLAGQVDEAVDTVAGTYGPTTSHAGMGEAAQRGARSWISKFEETSRKVYEAIPISPKTPAALDNTRQALAELTTIFESNPKMAEAFKNTRLNRYMDALTPQVKTVEEIGPLAGLNRFIGNEKTQEVGGLLSWGDLKAFRSRIGEEISDQRFSDSPTKSELRRLYGALSEDMRTTAQARGPQALRAFERANTLYRQGQQRIDDALVKILGDDSKKAPEAAATKLQSIVREGKSSSDLKLVHDVWRSLPAAERGEVANGLIGLMGQPTNAAGREFSPQTFMNVYSGMAPKAKNLIFGAASKDLRANLDEFATVIGDIAKNNSTRNTSNTAMGLAGGLGLFAGGPMGLLTQVGGSYSAARIWTNPKFVRWATGYAKMLKGAQRAGNQPSAGGIRTQVKLLDRLAAGEPALAQDILPIRDAILRGVNDNAAPSVAASGSDDQKQRQ